MQIFRIHIRPRGGLADSKVSFDYCLKKQVLGVGWQIKSRAKNISWEYYEKEAIKIHDKDLSRVRYLKNNIKENDLIWTRDTKGNYYLAKVLIEWEYYSNPEAEKADIVNVCRCKIIKVHKLDDVPGKVIASFRASRTIQRINDTTSKNYSKFLWNKISKSNDYTLDKGKLKNVYSFLDSETTEDIIFIYLQTQNWLVIPNSRKADTMSYEFYLIHKKNHQRAIVQVKTGDTPLNVADWSGRKEKVFLFQSNGKYQGQGTKEVVCLSPDVIKDFMHKNKDILPSNVNHWLDILGSI